VLSGLRTKPITSAWVFIILSLGLALLFDAHRYPLLVREGGIIESLSALGYFICALVMLYRGGLEFVQRYHYLVILVILFGLRELDFDKRFTTMGILKSRFYTGDTVPFGEKLIGLAVIALLLYVVLRIVKNHSASFIAGIKKTAPQTLGTLSVIAALVFAKSIDGLDRKLSGIGLAVDPALGTQIGVIEEVLELGIPVLILATFTVYQSTLGKSNLSDEQPLTPSAGAGH